MHVLAIDVGSYSVKIISSMLEKKRAQHLEMREVLIQDILDQHSYLSTVDEAGIKIIQDAIAELARPETKIITNLPYHYVTTRFLTLPVKTRKKADMMVPFQLEENIPYSLNEVHYGYRLDVQKSQTLVLACLAKLSSFEQYFERMKQGNANMPQFLTTEASSIATYYSLHAIAGPFCLLDVGHSSTKAYFFYNSRLILTHVSYMGGKHIDEMIARTYRLAPAEAVDYKHKNAFVLTTPQFNMVDDAQKEFALLMDEVFKPLIRDFQRWELGFRVNHGLRTAQVFITGGTSSIKNLAPYLTERFALKTTALETFEEVRQNRYDLNPRFKAKFTIANVLLISLRAKSRLINLFSGRFAQSLSADIPLHSMAYIGVRISAVTLLLLVFLIVESFSLKKDIAFINQEVRKILKSETLQIPTRVRNALDKNPKIVMDKLTSKSKTISQQVSTLQSAHSIEALSPLVEVTSIARSSNAKLMRFKVDDLQGLEADFVSDSVDELKSLEVRFKGSTLSNPETKIENGKLFIKAAL
jgi:general secretion pathway protein L